MRKPKKVPRNERWKARRLERRRDGATKARKRAAELLLLADATNYVQEEDAVLYRIERERKALYASTRRARETIRENQERLRELAAEAKARRALLRQ